MNVWADGRWIASGLWAHHFVVVLYITAHILAGDDITDFTIQDVLLAHHSLILGMLQALEPSHESRYHKT